jgi:hypothetical protein
MNAPLPAPPCETCEGPVIRGHNGRWLRHCSPECRYAGYGHSGNAGHIEALNSPKWGPRVEKLRSVLSVGPQSTRDVLRACRSIYGWPHELTRHVLAAGHPLFHECAGIWTVA